MKPVRTVQRRPIRRKGQLLLASGALLILAVCLYLLTRPAAVTNDTTTEDAADLTLIDRDESQLARVTVSPKRSDAYALVWQEDRLKLDGDPDYPLREENMKVLAYYVTHLTADTVVATLDDAQDDELSEFGLSPAVCAADVVLSTGETYTIALGNAAPMDEVRYYARVSGDRRVFTVTSDVMDAINVPFYALHSVTRPAIDGDLVDRITISESVDFQAERLDSGWMMTRPASFPLDGTAMSALLTALGNIRFSTWTAEDSMENRAQYGLTSPVATLSLDFAASVVTVPNEEGETLTFHLPESNITILQGGAYSETADYYLYNGDIMTGTVVTFSFLRNFDWRMMLAATPFAYELNNLSAVDVDAVGKSARYRVRYTERVLPNNALETDENGNILYDLRVSAEGRTVTAEAFSAYYASLRALSGASLLDVPWTPSGDAVPSAQITVTPENGEHPLELALYPSEDGRLYLTIDGAAILTVPAAWAEAVSAFP